MDLLKHLYRQIQWSIATFGPANRRGTEGVIDHIRKEIEEVQADPGDLEEWVDLILLSFDGAWRSGHIPLEIIEAIEAKQFKNENRKWPDWRTAESGKAIEHINEFTTRVGYFRLGQIYCDDCPLEVQGPCNSCTCCGGTERNELYDTYRVRCNHG